MKILLSHNGKTQDLFRWSQDLGITVQQMKARYRLYKNDPEKMFYVGRRAIGRPKGQKPWNFKWGPEYSKEYNSWWSMFNRCTNPQSTAYDRYGGRGIKPSKRWLSFLNFLADMGRCPPKHQLERIDNNKGYSKKNCKWATRIEQANNTSKTVFLTFKGERLSVTQWSRKFGVNRQTIWARHLKGRPLDWPYKQRG